MTVPLPTPSLPDLRAGLASAAARLAALLQRGPDPNLPAIGTWTVGEVAAHAAGSASFFLAVLRGEAPPEAIEEAATNNAAFLAANLEREPAALAGRFVAGEQALLNHATALEGDPVVEVFRGVWTPASTLLAVELAEVLVHGFDIARATRLPWEIGRGEAALATAGLVPLLPHMLDDRKAAGFAARIDLRLRGAGRTLLVFSDGTLRVSAPDGGAVDCHLSADPAAYLLLSYRRVGPIAPMVAGKMLAWGRRPWLAARMSRLFRAP